MKKISSLLALFAVVILLVTGCKKVDPLPYYNDGSKVSLTASQTTIAPTPADSAKTMVTFAWTDPNYATDTAKYKFIVEIDSTTHNFSNPVRREIIGRKTFSFTGKELNNIMLNYGYALGAPVALDVRVVSSYENNNDRLFSDAVKIMVTPYNDPSVLTATATTVTATLPNAAQAATTFNWTPSFNGYTGTITYAIQYDSSGKNFASPQEVAVGAGVLTKALTQAEINATAINEGVVGGSAGKLEYRLKATTAQGAVAYSNAISVTINTYVPVPPNLYIVGDATPGGWDNPVPVPSQQFTKVDAYTFSITLGLTAGRSYLLLPLNGNWDSKYGGATDGTAAGGGVLLKDGAVPGSNTPSPAVSGIYKIVVNFQTGRYTVTKVEVPANLYIVGDATPGGWDNPVAVPSQQFTRISDASYGIVINLKAGSSYLLLPSNGSWDHKFGGVTDGTGTGGGALLADGAVPGSNTPAPATSGLYKIIVNFATNSYTVTPYTGPANLYIVGDATPGGWDNPVPVPSQQFTKAGNAVFELTTTLTAGKSYVFLPTNGSWDHKYGGTTDGTAANGGSLLADGDVPGSNTPAPGTTGTYKITVNFISNTYKLVKL
ncbi:SusE domain-containing protein [Flavisolibacter sp. BT320]|nr:SusE domain-containing protein [Flavisolibacter longurius]